MAADGVLAFQIGFSDELSLQVDGKDVFTGECTWKDTPEWSDRGYASLEHRVELTLSRGLHTITAVLKATEYFGYGMALQIVGGSHKLMPIALCD
jgi:hypothetical protein